MFTAYYCSPKAFRLGQLHKKRQMLETPSIQKLARLQQTPSLMGVVKVHWFTTPSSSRINQKWMAGKLWIMGKRQKEKENICDIYLMAKKFWSKFIPWMILPLHWVVKSNMEGGRQICWFIGFSCIRGSDSSKATFSLPYIDISAYLITTLA